MKLVLSVIAVFALLQTTAAGSAAVPSPTAAAPSPTAVGPEANNLVARAGSSVWWATTSSYNNWPPNPSNTYCIPGYRGKRNGKGPNGACCSHSRDCKDTCVKNVCGVHP
jgi:hypothetical protein